MILGLKTANADLKVHFRVWCQMQRMPRVTECYWCPRLRSLTWPIRTAAAPLHALNIKGRISKHPKKERERGERNGKGLTFIRPPFLLQLYLAFHKSFFISMALVTCTGPQQGKGSFLLRSELRISEEVYVWLIFYFSFIQGYPLTVTLIAVSLHL